MPLCRVMNTNTLGGRRARIKSVVWRQVDQSAEEPFSPSPSSHPNTRRQISGLALPALMSLLVDPILSLVDTAYVGRGLGAISLAALGEFFVIFPPVGGNTHGSEEKCTLLLLLLWATQHFCFVWRFRGFAGSLVWCAPARR